MIATDWKSYKFLSTGDTIPMVRMQTPQCAARLQDAGWRQAQEQCVWQCTNTCHTKGGSRCLFCTLSVFSAKILETDTWVTFWNRNWVLGELTMDKRVSLCLLPFKHSNFELLKPTENKTVMVMVFPWEEPWGWGCVPGVIRADFWGPHLFPCYL